jgi:hypothetical protein
MSTPTLREALAADNFEWSSLYNAVSHMMARLGADGSISTDAAEVERVMDALHRLDAGQFVPGLAPRAALAQREVHPVAHIRSMQEPLIPIAPDARKGKPPCGECHIQPGETCDICGAASPQPPQQRQPTCR